MGVTPLAQARMWACASPLLMSCLVDGRTLCNTVVMALPDDIGIRREGEEAFNGLTIA